MSRQQQYLTTEDIARHYGVVPSRIRQVVMREGHVPAARDGRRSLWAVRQLESLNPRKIRKCRYNRGLGSGRSKSGGKM